MTGRTRDRLWHRYRPDGTTLPPTQQWVVILWCPLPPGHSGECSCVDTPLVALYIPSRQKHSERLVDEHGHPLFTNPEKGIDLRDSRHVAFWSYIPEWRRDKAYPL